MNASRYVFTAWMCGRCQRTWPGRQPRWHRHLFKGWSWHEVMVEVVR